MLNKATLALRWFETARRPDGSEFVRLREGAPPELRDLVYQAHGRGQMMPDDWRYCFVRHRPSSPPLTRTPLTGTRRPCLNVLSASALATR
jgi:hypothetical protein